MQDASGHRRLGYSAMGLCALGVAVWAAGLWTVDGRPWTVRLGLLAGGVVLVGGAAASTLLLMRKMCRTVGRHFDALCRIDPLSLRSDGAPADLPPLAAGCPLGDVARRVRETLVRQAERLAELEHGRAASEIRCRRAAAEAERVRAVLAGLSDPILAIDHFDELVLANTAAETLFNFRAESAEDRALARLVRCDRLVDLLRGTCHRQTVGKRTDEIEVPNGDGRSHWFRVTATKLAASADDGETAGADHVAVAVLSDIDNLKALQKRNAEFVSAVSHEMKTPLAGIKAYVELLADGDAEDEETREEFLDVINSQADRLQRLIDNLLNLARIEAGVVQVNKASRSLNEVLEEAAQVVHPSAEAKSIQLASELSPMYLSVLADRDMLLQSAINLLSNAVKYTPEGGRVTLRSKVDGEQIVFEVEDTGVGLSEEDCGRVFEKFYRVKKDKNMASGTGLGLPLAKHIVEDVHGGRMTVASTEGEGSTFSVTLPRADQLTCQTKG